MFCYTLDQFLEFSFLNLRNMSMFYVLRYITKLSVIGAIKIDIPASNDLSRIFSSNY